MVESSFVPASLPSLVGFLLVVSLVVGMLTYAALKYLSSIGIKIVLFTLVWISILSLVVWSGWLEEESFPGVPLFFALINLGAIAFGMSSWGKALAGIPAWLLIAFQGFRLPLELVLHVWADQGTIPDTMTWTGQNYDIVSGLLALFVLLPAFRNKAYYWFWNLSAGFLLLNVLRVVILSSPLPFAWDLDRPLQLIFHMPYALIGIVCVWAAIVGHIVLTRALLRPRM